jgi:hypothetical protein
MALPFLADHYIPTPSFKRFEKRITTFYALIARTLLVSKP